MSDQFVFGLHAVAALINHPKRPIKHIFVSASRQDKRIQGLLTKIQQAGIPITPISTAKMDTKFPDVVHQGIVAVTQPMPVYQEQDIPTLLNEISTPPLLLILDGVTDPHNLGACLRSADGAGVNFVIIPKDNSAPLTPTVSKVACGAAETIPLIRVTNLARALETLKQLGVWIYGAAEEAPQTLYQLDADRPLALVLGAEGEGMRRLTKDRCDGLFSIPMHGSVPSLNVSVAAGVCLFEIRRHRTPL